jgi:hypothetical protein
MCDSGTDHNSLSKFVKSYEERVPSHNEELLHLDDVESRSGREYVDVGSCRPLLTTRGVSGTNERLRVEHPTDKVNES